MTIKFKELTTLSLCTILSNSISANTKNEIDKIWEETIPWKEIEAQRNVDENIYKAGAITSRANEIKATVSEIAKLLLNSEMKNRFERNNSYYCHKSFYRLNLGDKDKSGEVTKVYTIENITFCDRNNDGIGNHDYVELNINDTNDNSSQLLLYLSENDRISGYQRTPEISDYIQIEDINQLITIIGVYRITKDNLKNYEQKSKENIERLLNEKKQ